MGQKKDYDYRVHMISFKAPDGSGHHCFVHPGSPTPEQLAEVRRWLEEQEVKPEEVEDDFTDIA